MNGWERVRIVHYFLCGEPVGTGYCSENCGECHIRFECYTTRKGTILHSFFPMAQDIHTIQPYEFELGEFKVMRCPHCLSLFRVTYDQLNNNTKFRCKVCGKYNWGSCKADEYDILIGELHGNG